MPNIGRISQASMSTWTQACKPSMPNQWARSHRLQCQHGHKHANYQYQTNGHDLIGFNVNMDTSTQTINTKPMGTISQANSMSTRHQHTNQQYQTNKYNLISCSFRRGTNHSLPVIKAEYFQLMFLGFICYKLKLIDIITSSTFLSISYD